jgi:hypothetical protein
VITIETHSLTVLQMRDRASRHWCAACGAETLMATAMQAARAFSITQRTIFRLVENNRIHFVETPEGQMMICLDSLQGMRKSSVDQRAE